MFKRGNIHLAKLYPNKGHEVGKTRPVVILQTDILNDVGHTTIIVIPLSTQLVDNSYPLRHRINARENLHETSEVLCDQVRAIDFKRLDLEIVASLTQEELILIEENIKIILEFH
ncbi:type II toxin-antitoxin system PemK/MazF family toxin [Sulfurimonas sp.]|nr:type II toxin-antitoxin system PemK/MazF family toxin [Sulfurimonas sp.]